MKVVLDTNIVISGIFFGGPSRRIFNKIVKINSNIEDIVSEDILKEYEIILREIKYSITEAKIKEVMNLIRNTFTILLPKNKIDICEHKEDNKFIECAVEGKADYIVSGDKHLLNLKKYNNIRIVSPSEFIKR